MKQDYILIKREDFEAWVELVGSEIAWQPRVGKAEVMTEGKLNGVTMIGRFTTVKVLSETEKGIVYTYSHVPSEWTHIKVPTFATSCVSLTGKGSRSQIAALYTILEVLTGEKY